MKPPEASIEIGRDSLAVFHAGQATRIDLERLEDGRLSPACQENIQRQVGALFSHPSGVRAPVLCALPASGAMLRVVSIPPCPQPDLVRVLTLQIESELPVAPSDLAWGYRVLPQRTAAPNTREALIAAIKKETVQHYQTLLHACGLEPVFTLGALARATLIPSSEEPFAMLDLGHSHSELALFNNGEASAVRLIAWGQDVVTKIAASLVPPGSLPTTELPSPDAEALRSAAELLASRLPVNGLGRKLVLTGDAPWLAALASQLTTVIGGQISCESLPASPLRQVSPTLAALNGIATGKSTVALLTLATTVEPPAKIRRVVLWHWPAWAAAVLAVLLFLRYLEPVVQEKRLAEKLAALRTYRASLPNVDRELAFLQNIKTNQAPYLDTVAVFSRSAPQGVVIESFAMQRRGDVSVRVGMRDPMQLAEFRTKLVDSGFFSAVVVEEQNPSPDNQKLTVRLTAQLKPLGQRKALTAEPPKEEAKPKPKPVKDPAPAGPKTTNAPSPKTT